MTPEQRRRKVGRDTYTQKKPVTRSESNLDVRISRSNVPALKVLHLRIVGSVASFLCNKM